MIAFSRVGNAVEDAAADPLFGNLGGVFSAKKPSTSLSQEVELG
jgi:hypothetical protein